MRETEEKYFADKCMQDAGHVEKRKGQRKR